MERETKTVRLPNDLTAQVKEIRSGDSPVGAYPGGLWHGYELCIRDTHRAVLDTAKIETHGYPTGVSVEISPDGFTLAIKAVGNDGFEQEDHTLGIYEISPSGKIKTLCHERREGGRIVSEYPRIFWIQDSRIKVEWVTTVLSSEEVTESITLDRTKPEQEAQ